MKSNKVEPESARTASNQWSATLNTTGKTEDQRDPFDLRLLHGQKSIREILPQIMNEQNRKTHGTWQRKSDFTLTIIGYLLGIHSFFRVPYLCYKYGGVFFIPYAIMMQIVAVPVVFMEFTIGQYYGVCSYVAFTHMSPILSCVSKLLTWSCVVNCWMYAVMMAWLRVYASASTSCLKGWEICDQNHYYNSPHCYTGIADDNCNDVSLADHNGITQQLVLGDDLLYYNYKCRTVKYYCEQQGWTVVPGKKKCVDADGNEHNIYERRFHAIHEYFYGAVLGLKPNMETTKQSALITETLLAAGTDVHGLRTILYGNRYHEDHSLYSQTGQEYVIETVRIYLRRLETSRDRGEQKQYQDILDAVASPKYQKEYWTEMGKRFSESEDSSSYISLTHVSITTWITIAVFLFEDLLKISILSYLLNAVPFLLLIYMTWITCSFEYSWYGIEQIFEVKKGFWLDLGDLQMWAEAAVQAIYASGIGSGCLISVATFNNFENSYLFDLYFTLCLSIVSAGCGVLISFGSIGHYLKHFDIDIPFREYIKSCSSVSSIEFCFLAYSHFLTLNRERSLIILAFFFLITSFATDTAVRLIQNVLDTIHSISPRLKHHPTMVMVAVCVMGYLILVPVMKNGGYVLFIDFEYFVTQYMMPTIVAIEIAATIFIYKASRVVDHAEQMGVFNSCIFRLYITGLLYISFCAVVYAVVVNVCYHSTIRFNSLESDPLFELFGWVFFISPFLMGVLSIVKHLIVIDSRHRRWLLVPLQGKDRRNRRAFLRRNPNQNRGKQEPDDEATDQEQIRAAAAQMRVMESKFILAMMHRRREEQEKKKELEAADKLNNKDSEGNVNALLSRESKLPPLFASFVRVAAAEFGKRNSQTEAIPEAADANVEEEEEEEGGFCACSGIRRWHRRRKEAKEKEKIDLPEKREEKRERARRMYLNIMDAIERWPGRLDESDFESEGSIEDAISDTEVEHENKNK